MLYGRWTDSSPGSPETAQLRSRLTVEPPVPSGRSGSGHHGASTPPGCHNRHPCPNLTAVVDTADPACLLELSRRALFYRHAGPPSWTAP
jgi:hypothetical protein